MLQQPIAVDILSDDDDVDGERRRPAAADDGVIIDVSTPVPPVNKRQKKQVLTDTTVFIIDDDPTPRKPSVGPGTTSSTPSSVPSIIPETPFSEVSNHNASGGVPCMVADTPITELSKTGEHPIIRCNQAYLKPSTTPITDAKFSGISGLICLESDDEAERSSGLGKQKESSSCSIEMVKVSDWSSRFSKSSISFGSQEKCLTGNADGTLTYEGNSCQFNSVEDDISAGHDYHYNGTERLEHSDNALKQKGLKANQKEGRGKKRISKEERILMNEEKKRKKEEEKLQRATQKAEAAEMRKLQKEKQKWEKGKFALKSIVAEIDTKVIELGSVGGHLLTRFSEKGLSYRVTSNQIERSIIWTMSIPEEISQISTEGVEVPYVLLVYEAEEFCNLVTSESLMEHVSCVQRRYPNHTICYLTNRLMAYINKREQGKYKCPANYVGWKRPPIEEALSKLAIQFARVHSRMCIDEAELADHVVGLTCSLASCQFRKKLTRLSVNANGSLIPKDCVDKNLIKKSLWLKALIAIPKVQPRFAIAIWKKYPTMKSLLSVYMDPSKSVHEKEFLLKDLTIEGLLGDDRRLGEVCSKRVYRILMAQCGSIRTDDVENGADFFSTNS